MKKTIVTIIGVILLFALRLCSQQPLDLPPQ
jgi:predicted small lipoprotein YifL